MPSIEVSQCVCLLTLLWSLVEVHSQTSTPFISFRGQNLSNNSYVDFNQVGVEIDGSDSVRCRSELEPPKTTKRYSVLKTQSACLSSVCRMC